MLSNLVVSAIPEWLCLVFRLGMNKGNGVQPPTGYPSDLLRFMAVLQVTDQKEPVTFSIDRKRDHVEGPDGWTGTYADLEARIRGVSAEEAYRAVLADLGLESLEAVSETNWDTEPWWKERMKPHGLWPKPETLPDERTELPTLWQVAGRLTKGLDTIGRNSMVRVWQAGEALSRLKKQSKLKATEWREHLRDICGITPETAARYIRLREAADFPWQLAQFRSIAEAEDFIAKQAVLTTTLLSADDGQTGLMTYSQQHSRDEKIRGRLNITIFDGQAASILKNPITGTPKPELMTRANESYDLIDTVVAGSMQNSGFASALTDVLDQLKEFCVANTIESVNVLKALANHLKLMREAGKMPSWLEPAAPPATDPNKPQEN